MHWNRICDAIPMYLHKLYFNASYPKKIETGTKCHFIWSLDKYRIIIDQWELQFSLRFPWEPNLARNLNFSWKYPFSYVTWLKAFRNIFGERLLRIVPKHVIIKTNSLHAGLFLYCFFLVLHWAFFFKISLFFKAFFQEYHHHIENDGSRSEQTFSRAESASKVKRFAISFDIKQTKSKRKKIIMQIHSKKWIKKYFPGPVFRGCFYLLCMISIYRKTLS